MFRLLIVHCELHVALLLERRMARQGNEARIVTEQDDLGAAFAEFEPSHVIAGTNDALQAATAIIEKRGSLAKITRLR